jgi:hypothetical protein
MMITVQPLRPTPRTTSDSVMNVWKTFDTMMEAIDSGSAAFKNKKRIRDSFEAYDFQVHKQQRMRYSLLRENSSEDPSHQKPTSVFPGDSLVSLSKNGLVKPRLVPPPFEGVNRRPSKNDDIRRMRRQKKSKKSRRGGAQRMTKKHYNKKKKLEMMEATARDIQNILGASHVELSHRSIQKLKHYRSKVEQLDLSLRDQCNSIVYKEQEIKSWLGMTTKSRSQIINLRKRLHERWGEVKDLQTLVKPRRQRLKNLKFAARCEERSIAEEP